MRGEHLRVSAVGLHVACADRGRPVRRKVPLAEGQTARTTCVRVLVRSGVEEKTGELLPPAVVARRVA